MTTPEQERSDCQQNDLQNTGEVYYPLMPANEEQNIEVYPTGSINSESTENVAAQIEQLKNILLEGSRKKISMSLTEIDSEFAAKYKLKTAKTNVKSKFHLDDIEADSVELKINRTDQRVSHQVITVDFKTDMNKVICEFQCDKSFQLKERFAVNFQNLLGMKVESNILTLDTAVICKSSKPAVHRHEVGLPKWSEETTLLPSRDRGERTSDHVRLMLKLHTARDIESLKIVLNSCSILKSVYSRGIQPSYESDKLTNVSTEDLARFYPVLSYPVLCRAAQLVSIETADRFCARSNGQITMDDVKLYIKTLSALQAVFEELLLKRNCKDSSKIEDPFI